MAVVVGSSYMWRLWDVLMGKYPPHPPREIPIVISLLYYSLTILLGRVLRLAVSRLAPARLQPYLRDAVSTFQVLACSLENGQIRKHYGHGAYLLVIFSLCMWYWLTVKDATSNPCGNLLRYLQGAVAFPELIGLACFQVAGGLASYRYARQFWSLGLYEGHLQRYKNLHCVADLQVPVPVGLLIEFSATMLDVFLCLSTFTPFYVCEVMTKSLLGCTLVTMGLHLTGMYLNPINAMNQTFGCHGVSTVEHFVVYWLGPIAGTVSAVILHRHLHEIWKSLKLPSSMVAQTNVTDTRQPSSDRQKVKAQNSDTPHMSVTELPNQTRNRKHQAYNGGGMPMHSNQNVEENGNSMPYVNGDKVRNRKVHQKKNYT